MPGVEHWKGGQHFMWNAVRVQGAGSDAREPWEGDQEILMPLVMPMTLIDCY